MKYDTAFICNIGSQCHDNTDFYKSFLLAVQTLNHLVTPAIFHNIERGEKKLEFRLVYVGYYFMVFTASFDA